MYTLDDPFPMSVKSLDAVLLGLLDDDFGLSEGETSQCCSYEPTSSEVILSELMNSEEDTSVEESSLIVSVS